MGDGYFAIEERDYALWRDDSMLGQRVADRFIVVAVLGRGSMGRVYRAIQTGVGRPVALKIMAREEVARGSRGPGTTAREAQELDEKRFIQEARVLGQLSHPNCVTLFDFGVSGDLLYIAMEYVAGITLRDAIGRGLRGEAILDITRQILQALRQAHSLDIVHRDLKPENIILSLQVGSEERVVKVLDFGIAKLIGGGSISGVHTTVGLLFGTPAYMSPEQCRGDVAAVGPRADIYALGCLLYEMICGRLPYASDLPQRLVIMHQEAPIPPLQPRPGVELVPGIEHFVHRCLAKDPASRFAHAKAALQELERLTGASEGDHASTTMLLPDDGEWPTTTPSFTDDPPTTDEYSSLGRSPFALGTLELEMEAIEDDPAALAPTRHLRPLAITPQNFASPSTAASPEGEARDPVVEHRALHAGPPAAPDQATSRVSIPVHDPSDVESADGTPVLPATGPAVIPPRPATAVLRNGAHSLPMPSTAHPRSRQTSPSAAMLRPNSGPGTAVGPPGDGIRGSRRASQTAPLWLIVMAVTSFTVFLGALFYFTYHVVL